MYDLQRISSKVYCDEYVDNPSFDNYNPHIK
jgi:hypothetical protein